MAPRSRFLDLERDDVLFFYGDVAYQHQSSDRVSVGTYGIVFWPVLFLVAALLLHLIAPSFPDAAAACGALYVAYCFLLDRTAQASTSSLRPSTAAGVPLAEPSRATTRRGTVAGYTVMQNY